MMQVRKPRDKRSDVGDGMECQENTSVSLKV